MLCLQMKNYYVLALALLCSVYSTSFAQIRDQDQIGDQDSDWKKISSDAHQKGKWLTGGGIVLFGLTAKVGTFVANRTWVGLGSEICTLSSWYKEAGIYGRYYLWNGGFVSGFSEAGVSYGYYWLWEGDTPLSLYSPKINAGFGLEYTLGRRFSLEGVIKLGRLPKVDQFHSSFQGSVNFYFGR